MSAPLLDVRGLSIHLRTRDGMKEVVSDMSFSVAPGEALGIVGESGSGKTLSMLSLLQLLPRGAVARAQHAVFDGRDLLRLSPSQLAGIRGREIGFVFQDSLSALNPVLTIGDQIAEVCRLHFAVSQSDANNRSAELLVKVGIADPQLRMRQYPHEFSGGMRQRVCIAMALAGEPRLLIADEPTTALDVTVQAAIVNIVKELQRTSKLTVIWVTHDLALLARLADRVIVLYGGRVMEDASAKDLFEKASHPYAISLLSSVRHDGADRASSFQDARALSGPASHGCPFAPRCAEANARCATEAPLLQATSTSHQVACWARTGQLREAASA